MSAVRFSRIAVVGLGLLGGSVARAVRAHLPAAVTLGFDADPAVRARAREISLADEVPETIDEAVAGADLVVLCVPVGAMEAAGRAIAPHLAAGVVVTDVGSSKASVARALADALPGVCVIPSHPVAGTEQSGPDAGFAALSRCADMHASDRVDPVRKLPRALWQIDPDLAALREDPRFAAILARAFPEPKPEQERKGDR